MTNSTFSPFAHPLYVMLKPAGAQCNLVCNYCYYLEKSRLYKASKQQRMSDQLLEKFTEEYINAQTTPNILFTWHGGETMLMPIEFYEKALFYQKKYANGRTIDNSLQTNGTLITEEWCRFLKKNDFLVGVSIDGLPTHHDTYRKDQRGNPTFQRVMEGIRLLNLHDVEWNGMAVVNDRNVKDPLGFYHFFKSIDCRYIQFTPIVERYARRTDGLSFASPMEDGESTLTSFSVKPAAWGEFLCTLFDEWVRHDVGRFYIQLFDATLANWVGAPCGVCTMAKSCGHAGVMEFNGDVYACDHFVFPEYKLGNIYDNTLLEMFYSKEQKAFGRLKQEGLPSTCQQCEYLFACNGECPKNRFIKNAQGEQGVNYLCQGYYHFFSHVAPYMDFMKQELIQQRPPANVMRWAQQRQTGGA